MLRIEGLGFGYSDGPLLFSDVNFTIEAGASVAVVGRNGAGKSTLFRLMNGLLQPKKGRVLVGDADTRDTPAHILARTVGSVFQSPEQQIFEARVRDEVEFGPRQFGWNRTEIEERTQEALARTGLTESADAHPLDLDRASRRFVALASVLSMQPRLLLLDEPQQGLDFQSVKRLEKILQEEREKGTAAVFISHEMEFVARNANRILVMGEGRLLADSDPTQILSDEELVQRAGLEIPAPLAMSKALGLPPALTTIEFVRSWKARLKGQG